MTDEETIRIAWGRMRNWNREFPRVMVPLLQEEGGFANVEFSVEGNAVIGEFRGTEIVVDEVAE